MSQKNNFSDLDGNIYSRANIRNELAGQKIQQLYFVLTNYSKTETE